jgi:hypothetical protein
MLIGGRQAEDLRFTIKTINEKAGVSRLFLFFNDFDDRLTTWQDNDPILIFIRISREDPGIHAGDETSLTNS